jgi:hypothetical protein
MEKNMENIRESRGGNAILIVCTRFCTRGYVPQNHLYLLLLVLASKEKYKNFRKKLAEDLRFRDAIDKILLMHNVCTSIKIKS